METESKLINLIILLYQRTFLIVFMVSLHVGESISLLHLSSNVVKHSEIHFF